MKRQTLLDPVIGTWQILGKIPVERCVEIWKDEIAVWEGYKHRPYRRILEMRLIEEPIWPYTPFCYQGQVI